jgi:cyclase
MLKKRIIPVLLYKDNGLVKGKKFDSSRVIGSVIPTIKIFNNRQVDELIFLDINATSKNKINYELIHEISKYSFVPFTVGGGIKSLDNIQLLLANGADKVSINTAAYLDQNLIHAAVAKFGSQCIIISIDVKKIDGEYICFRNSGSVQTEYNLSDWLKIVNTFNIGEILITSIDNDGIMNGYDIDLIKIVQNTVKVPVIASGGCSSYNDMLNVFTQTDVSALCASSIFQFTQCTPKLAKDYLHKNNINIRPYFT